MLVPFGNDVKDEATSQFAKVTFRTCSQLLEKARPGEVAILQTKIGRTDEALAIFGQKIEAGFMLGARDVTVDGKPTLSVRLIKGADGTVVWTQDFPVESANAAQAAARIVDEVLTIVPEKAAKKE